MLFESMSRAQLEDKHNELLGNYKLFQERGLRLDMSRGKPCKEQLELSEALLSMTDTHTESGVDCRNYGVLEGVAECRALFAQMLDVREKNVIVMGNSSLNVMFDYISQCMTHGAGEGPWSAQGKIKFACPAPGYDRHFSICEYFGIEMVNVPMLDSGPDMDVLEEVVKDSSVKGMFCVPKYTNPQGITFDDATVRRIAALKPAAKDFRVIWDNAYVVHDLKDRTDPLLEIFKESEKYSNEDMFIEVASTSKITFAGGGIAAVAASDKNIAMIKKRLSMQTIGFDKLNQLRHTLFLKDINAINAHMKRQAEVIAPKFEVVLEALDRELSGKGVASWSKPNGGYFISLDVLGGCAKRTVELCREAGVVLTPAGATFPYSKDPADSNIRIAPTFPPVEELKLAVSLLCLCVELAAVEKLLGK